MNFVEIARFASRLEAEAIGHALDQYDIPFFVQSHDIGMFGPGHLGRTPGGAGLCVPADRAEEASELLRCAVRGEAGDDEDGDDEDGDDEDGDDEDGDDEDGDDEDGDDEDGDDEDGDDDGEAPQ